MEQVQLRIGQVMLSGLILSVFVIAIGGFLYLFHHGTQIAQYTIFHEESESLTHIPQILSGAFHLIPRAIIQLGLWLLVLTQILRLILTFWLFKELKDTTFILITLFVTMVVIGTSFMY